MIRRCCGVTLLGFALVCGAFAAWADEGRIEINQARVDAGGITPSDTPGFPVTIDAPGSYVLTSDLTGATVSETGILITTGEVTIDLNGFTLLGNTTCTGSGSAISCSAASGLTLVGIDAVGQSNIRIHNGRVIGWNVNMRVGDAGIIEDVVTRWSFATAIFAGNASTIRNVTAYENRIAGIDVAQSSVIESSIARGNGARGLAAEAESVVRGNTSSENGADGLFCRGCTVLDNNFSDNEEHGLEVVFGSTNLIADNLIRANEGGGVTVNTTAFLQNNAVTNNTGFAIEYTGGASTGSPSYRDNHITGTITGSWVDGGGNVCNGSTTCP